MQERIFASDIPWFRTQNGFFAVGSMWHRPQSAGQRQRRLPGRDLPPGRPQRHPNPRGLIPITQPTGAGALCGTGTAANFGGPNNNGTPYNCTYIFDERPVASSRQAPGSAARPAASSSAATARPGREGQTISILPFLERYNANLLFHYTFSPALEVFAEAKWARVNALGNNSGPSFIQGQNTQFDFRERPRLDNPFLNPADRRP